MRRGLSRAGNRIAVGLYRGLNGFERFISRLTRAGRGSSLLASLRRAEPVDLAASLRPDS